MKKRIVLFIATLFLLCSPFLIKNVAYAESEKIYLGGMPAGFSVTTRGAYIVGLSDVICDSGVYSPSKDAGIQVGDVILSIDGKEVNNAEDISKTVKNGNTKILEIQRNYYTEFINVVPKKDLSGDFRLGVFIRDNLNGIGTVTFIKGNKFASLGHPILDDNGKIIDVLGGKLYDCNINGYIKGKRGTPGELHGSFSNKNVCGEIDKNLICGVFGKIDKNFNKKNLIEIQKGQAKMGDAYIRTTIDDNKEQLYAISIVKVDLKSNNKNFVIKITDDKLLEKTGGIVQGMSGSPIVQDDKLVGAVTHVFINDPSRGFGISIDNMLDNI